MGRKKHAGNVKRDLNLFVFETKPANRHVLINMKTLCVMLLVTACASGHAQQAVVENGRLVYNGHEFRPGQMIRLGYGSRQDKNFAFVFFSGHNQPASPLHSLYCNYECKVIKWRRYKGKYFMKARPVGRRHRIQIDVVGAIDNQELVF